MKVKICGLTRRCDIEAVNILKPDYVGFVFANSRRQVTVERARELRNGEGAVGDGAAVTYAPLHGDIAVVGVFVNEPVSNILSLVKNGTIDVIQLHGFEDEDYIKALKELTDVPVIKAVPVTQLGDVQRASDTAADFLLLDQRGGGTGECFDWSLIGDTDKPYFLAGGLSCENIGYAGERIGCLPYAFDVSSGVETGGVKDFAKMEFFCRCSSRISNIGSAEKPSTV